MRIVKLEKRNLSKLAKETKRQLAKGGLAVIPSDTAYCLAARADSPEATKKIFDFKGRRFGKGISIFLNKIKEIRQYAQLSKNQDQIVKALLPGPFTLVLKSKHKTARETEAEDKTIGIRIVNQPFIKELTRISSFPITATSANIANKGPHYSINSFLKTLSKNKKEMIDLIVDQGKLTKKPTSSVVRLVNDEIETLRKGVFNPELLDKYQAKKEKDTKEIGQEIFKQIFKNQLKNKSVIAILEGDLGAGKTVFAKGIGELFNLQFTSPTFVLMDEYQINQEPVKNIYHLDLYRLETEKEISQLKIEKLIKRGNLILIEWGEKLSIFQSLKKETVAFFWIQIKKEKKEQRKITIYQV